jgi:hypothetical protein
MAGNAERVRELRGMAVIWRDLGLRVLEMDGWENRGRSSVISFDCFGCHHTAAERDLDGLLRDGRSDVPGPLCNCALHLQAPAGWLGEVVLVASGRANHFGEATISSSRGLGVEATGPKPITASGPGAFPNYQAYILLAAGYCIYFKRDPAEVILPASPSVYTAVRRITHHKLVAVPKGRKIDVAVDTEVFLGNVVQKVKQIGTPKEWWQVSIPETELTRIKDRAAVPALEGERGRAAITAAVRAAAADILAAVGTSLVFVQQLGPDGFVRPQVYALLSGQLIHMKDPATFTLYAGANAWEKIVQLPEDAPIWQLPISGPKPGETVTARAWAEATEGTAEQEGSTDGR